MSFLSKLRSKHVWNNIELQRKSEQYDKFALVSMVLIVLSAWLTPQYIPEYAKTITLAFVGISLLMMILSWYTEKKDSKYIPPTVDDNQNDNNQ
jgi:hypothetical protein